MKIGYLPYSLPNVYIQPLRFDGRLAGRTDAFIVNLNQVLAQREAYREIYGYQDRRKGKKR